MIRKICHLSSVHVGLDSRIFRKECVSLANAGYETHLVTNATVADAEEAARYGVKLHPIEYLPKTGRLARMSLHARRCYLVAKRLDADLYHFHDPELIPYGVLLARAGKKVIFDAHEDLPGEVQSKDWLPLPTRRLIAAMCRTLETAGARRFSAVVTATPYIAPLFEGAARRVVVINNYPIRGELAAPARNTSEQRDSVCYVGSIDTIRGIREIVKAAESGQANLLLAGTFATDELRNEVTQFPGWRNVKEYGHVGRHGVAEIMSKSFSGLVIFHPVPNFINAQPIKMFEYMSAGIPVIGSNFPSWREIIEGNQCGICVNPDRPEEIASAIAYLRAHPAEAIRMGANGRIAVEKKYRWDGEEQKLLALYDNLFTEKQAA